MLMMLDPTHALNVVPGCRLVAEITLIHFRIRLFRYGRRHHRKVHHVMAGWWFVALRAFGGAGGWVDKLRIGPLRRRMTLDAARAKQALMSVFRRMATGAIKHGFVVIIAWVIHW